MPQGKAAYLQGCSVMFEVSSSRFGAAHSVLFARGFAFFSLGVLRSCSLTARRTAQVPELHAAIAKYTYPSFYNRFSLITPSGGVRKP